MIGGFLDCVGFLIKKINTSLIILLYFKCCAFFFCQKHLSLVFMNNDDKPLKVVEF